MPTALLATLLALCAAPDEGPRDALGALEALGDASSDVRARGERWLSANLESEHFPLLADFLRGGDLETRRRVASALASDERHLDLGALCLADPQPQVKEVGHWAMTELVLRWLGPEGLRPVSAEELWNEHLAGTHFAEWSMDGGALSTDRGIEHLTRLALREPGPFASDLPLRVALAPTVHAAQSAGLARPPLLSGPRLVGTWETLLAGLAGQRSLRLEGFGLEGPSGWLHVCRRSEQGRYPAHELVMRWCEQVLDYPGRPLGEGAARALAATGWPAAVSWLERRWLESGDDNALAGLLLAASRQRVAPGLASASSVDGLLSEASAELRAGTRKGRRRAGWIQLALAGIGSRGAAGEDLVAVVLRDWRDQAPPEAWLRLGVAAAMGGGSSELREGLVTELAEPTPALADPRVRLQLLRALAAAGTGPSGPVESPPDLATSLVLAADWDAADLAVDWLVRLGVRPPPSWSSVANLPAGVPSGAILGWWLAEGDVDPAGALVAELCVPGLDPRGSPVFARLLKEVERGSRILVAEVLEAARARAGEDRAAPIDRLALGLGLLSDRRVETLLEQIDGADPVRLGELAGHARGETARDRLLELLESQIGTEPSRRGRTPEIPPALISGLERALVGMLRNGLVEEHRQWRERLGGVLREALHPLYLDLEAGTWPGYGPESGPRALERLEWNVQDIWGPSGRPR